MVWGNERGRRGEGGIKSTGPSICITMTGFGHTFYLNHPRSVNQNKFNLCLLLSFHLKQTNSYPITFIADKFFLLHKCTILDEI